jgi:hypothetical protein
VKKTADVTGGKPITVSLQSISGVSAVNPLVAFYDIYGGKKEVLFFFIPDTTRHSSDTVALMLHNVKLCTVQPVRINSATRRKKNIILNIA